MAAEYGESLSERELEITELVSQGLTNREVAEKLHLSHNTVKVHLRNIFAKTGVASRTELSMLAVQEGWISVPGATDAEANRADDAAQAPESQPADAFTVASFWPSWPWERWTALAGGVILALAVVLLPYRYTAPAAGVGPGEVFGSSAQAPNLVGPTTDDGWQELAPLPVRRAGLGAVALAGKIYAVGGVADNGATAQLDIYDVATNRWEQGSPRPHALANTPAAALDGRIWVPGGCDDALDPTAAVDVYNPEDDTWTQVAGLPFPICGHALTAYNGRIYVFGGWDGEVYRAGALEYAPGEDTWYELPGPQRPRGFGAAAVLGDRIFYVGGFDGDQELATCEVFFPETSRWESCPSMLQPRGGLSLIATGGRLYAIGGGWQAPLGFNERYTPATDQWNVIETPIVGEWRNLGAAPWETAIYTIGGWSGTDFLNRTYAVEVMPWRVFIPGAFRNP